MNLNLAILKENLANWIVRSEYDPYVLDLDISGVRIYQQGMKTRSSILYLIRGRIPGERGCCAVPGTEFECGTICRFLSFRSDLDDVQVLDKLQELFELFQDWQFRILGAISLGSNINEVLDICAEQLSNPIVMFDMYSGVIGIGGKIPHWRDILWENILEKGFFPLEQYPSIDENWVYNSPVPLYVPRPDLGAAFGCFAWRVQNRLIAAISSTEVYAPITQGQLSVLYIMKQLFSKSGFAAQTGTYGIQSESPLIEHLLDGEPVAASSVQNYLVRKRFRESQPFQCLFVFHRNGSEMDEIEKGYVASRVRRAFGTIAVSSREGGFVILLTCDPGTHPGSQFRNLMDKYDLYCCESISFKEITYLKHAYRQCLSVRELAAGTEDSVVRFDENCWPMLHQVLKRQKMAEMFCDPAIREIASARNGEALLKGLMEYILQGRNLSKTAETLFIHRNTLIYRIEKVQQMLGVDLSEVSSEELFRIYLSCRIALES